MKRLFTLLIIAASFFSQEKTFAQPANDLCAAATPIVCGQTISGNNTTATAADNPGTCAILGATEAGMWYTFYGDGADVTLTTCNAPATDFDTKITVWSGSCGALSCEGGNDDQSGAIDPACVVPSTGSSSNRASTLTIPTVCGEQYFVYVYGFAGDVGNFDLTMSCAGLGNPTGDVAVQDITVQLDATGNYVFDTPLTPQTEVEVLIADGSTTGNHIWQSFTPTVSGFLHQIEVTFAVIPADPTVDVLIFDGQGNGGTYLSTGYVEVTAAGSPSTIDMGSPWDSPVNLIAGNEYTFQVSGVGVLSYEIQRSNSDPYAGGISSVGAGTDLKFSVDILQRPMLDNGTTDPDGIDHWELSQTAFGCGDVGDVDVTLTAYDKLGNSSACVATVTVEDNEAPVAACVPDAPTMVELALDAAGNHTVDPADIDNGSTDNCTFTLSTVPASFTCAEVGPQSIALSATDPGGLTTSCTTTIVVVDNIPPTAICQPHTLVLDGAGSGTVTTADIDNASDDNCGVASLTLDITTFNCSNIGANTVELTVTDVNGLVSTCTETVTVEDNEDPVLTCPANIEVCAEDASGATVTYVLPTATDNCSSTISQTDVSGLTSGSVFPLGPTAQQWTATDGTNSVACDFTVTVNATPVAVYSYSAACQGESTFFTDESTIDVSTTIDSWEWDMDDGSSFIGLVDPIHAFGDTGMFDVELVVISAEGCSDTATQTVHVTPVPVAGFTFTGACEGNATVFTNTSSIDAGNLNHTWDFGDSNTSTDESPSHTYALDGTYTVTLTVTSDEGCEDVSTHSITVNDSPTALFSASTECEGTATTFTNLSTGDGVLSYSWDLGDASPANTDANPTYTYANDGTYTVVLTVTNDNLCVDVHTASVTINNLPAVSFTFSDVCEGTDADFVNTSDAGTYNWDLGDGNSSTLTDVSHIYSTFGTYDVTLSVTSPQFCISSAAQTIEIYDLPDFTLTPTDVLCYGEATGELVAVAIPPAASPWTLSIDGGTPQASVTFGGLSAGTYDITAFDANGCEFTVSGTIDQPTDTLGININDTVDILCNGEATGEINVNGTGGTSPYMYSVDAGTQQMTGMFSGLEAGIHAIQITDASLCVFDTTITLTEPDTLVLAFVNAEDLLCNGDNTGEIAVVGTGGVLDYEYNVNGGAYGSDSLFTGLPAGMHIVGVLDENGCSDTLHVTLTEPGILQLSLVAVNDAICFQESNGSIEVAAASGTPPYQYSSDGISFQGSALFEGLAAGTYTITVMDANGCLDDLTETVFEPSQLTIETSSVPVACFGDATGEIEVIADGGTPGYEYSSDGGGSFAPNGGLFANVSTGNYLMVVSDANGCTASEGVIISQPASVFLLDADVTDAACLDSTSGIVELIGTGGTPTYLYSDDNSNFNAASVFAGYAAGSYTLYGQDLNGCSDSIDVVIGEPSTSVEITTTILANPACPNEDSGTATVTANGGTPGYTYSSNGGNTYQANPILAGLNGGNHLLMVQDANGCIDSDTIELTAPPLLGLTLDSIVGVDCEGDFSGEIHVTGIGGTPSYNYFLDGASLQSNGDYIGLSDGIYSVSIMDVNGCTFAEDVAVVATQMLPTADFNFTISGTAVSFDNQSAFGDTYLWEFDDDSTRTDMSPIHVYDEDGEYNVTLTVTNACGSENITILVSTTTIGISDNEMLSFGLYPNPASNQLFIQPSKSVNTELTLEVISTSGQLILSKQIARIDVTETVQLDVNGLSNGLYYLKIVGNEQQLVLRFDIIK
jgi:PKD repeat protein